MWQGHAVGVGLRSPSPGTSVATGKCPQTVRRAPGTTTSGRDLPEIAASSRSPDVAGPLRGGRGPGYSHAPRFRLASCSAWSRWAAPGFGRRCPARQDPPSRDVTSGAVREGPELGRLP